jgi:hypothetical protein
VSYGMTRAHEYEDEILLLKARAEKAEAERDELKKLSSHGNGEILLGWMNAHKKAMDRLEKAEASVANLMRAINLLAWQETAIDQEYDEGGFVS